VPPASTDGSRVVLQTPTPGPGALPGEWRELRTGGFRAGWWQPQCYHQATRRLQSKTRCSCTSEFFNLWFLCYEYWSQGLTLGQQAGLYQRPPWAPLRYLTPIPSTVWVRL